VEVGLADTHPRAPHRRRTQLGASQPAEHGGVADHALEHLVEVDLPGTTQDAGVAAQEFGLLSALCDEQREVVGDRALQAGNQQLTGRGDGEDLGTIADTAAQAEVAQGDIPRGCEPLDHRGQDGQRRRLGGHLRMQGERIEDRLRRTVRGEPGEIVLADHRLGDPGAAHRRPHQSDRPQPARRPQPTPQHGSSRDVLAEHASGRDAHEPRGRGRERIVRNPLDQLVPGATTRGIRDEPIQGDGAGEGRTDVRIDLIEATEDPTRRRAIAAVGREQSQRDQARAAQPVLLESLAQPPGSPGVDAAPQRRQHPRQHGPAVGIAEPRVPTQACNAIRTPGGAQRDQQVANDQPRVHHRKAHTEHDQHRPPRLSGLAVQPQGQQPTGRGQHDRRGELLLGATHRPAARTLRIAADHRRQGRDPDPCASRYAQQHDERFRHRRLQPSARSPPDHGAGAGAGWIACRRTGSRAHTSCTIRVSASRSSCAAACTLPASRVRSPSGVGYRAARGSPCASALSSCAAAASSSRRVAVGAASNTKNGSFVNRRAISGSSSGGAASDVAGISTHDSSESGCHDTAQGDARAGAEVPSPP
jgi:hypothetical protein